MSLVIKMKEMLAYCEQTMKDEDFFVLKPGLSNEECLAIVNYRMLVEDKLKELVRETGTAYGNAQNNAKYVVYRLSNIICTSEAYMHNSPRHKVLAQVVGRTARLLKQLLSSLVVLFHIEIDALYDFDLEDLLKCNLNNNTQKKSNEDRNIR